MFRDIPKGLAAVLIKINLDMVFVASIKLGGSTWPHVIPRFVEFLDDAMDRPN